MAIGRMMNQLKASQNVSLFDAIAKVMILNGCPFDRNLKLVFAATVS